MKTRQFIVLCLLIVLGFALLYYQNNNILNNIDLLNKIDESRDNYQFEVLKKKADNIIDIGKTINTNTILKRSD